MRLAPWLELKLPYDLLSVDFPLFPRHHLSTPGSPVRGDLQLAFSSLSLQSSIRTRKSSATISAPAEPAAKAKDAASSPLPKLPPNHPDYVDPSTNPANAPAEEDLKDLFEAKAMQEVRDWLLPCQLFFLPVPGVTQCR